jgi:hypothetical protein
MIEQNYSKKNHQQHQFLYVTFVEKPLIKGGVSGTFIIMSDSKPEAAFLTIRF